MIDLNRVCLLVAVISSLLVLARTWRGRDRHGSWRIAAVVVLGITGVAWLLVRGQAGYISAGAWFALLFVPTIGLRKMDELTARRRYRTAAQLGRLLTIVHPSADLREQVAYLELLQSRAHEPNTLPPSGHMPQDRHHFRRASAVFAFIVLNVVAFLIEISSGDWRDPLVLHQLGALEPYAVLVEGEYWRMFSALFLHGGAAHLMFNLFALYVLGPPLERSISAVRFSLCYLLSGLGSSAGVVLLTLLGATRTVQLVGASGCIMGIVGGMAAFLLRHRAAPNSRQRLANIALIVGIQVVFDLTTPQVSMAAHVCGFITGFVVVLVLAPRSTTAPAH